ncbi:MAG TPA: translation initiation factor IF-2 associated domain-containing protein, partial [Rhizomicrobium sp.]
MSDTDETKRPKTLSLKKTETSTVKQSFSHGRTKAVVVEKKRTLGAPSPKAAEKPASRADKAVPAPTAEAAKPAAKASPSRGGVVLRQLSDEEKARRAAAIADARVSDAEARRHAEEDARRRAQEEEKMKAERTAAEKRKAEEDARKAAEAEARRHAEAEAARRADPTKPMPVAAEPARRRPVQEEEEEAQTKKVGNKIIPVKPATPKKAGEGERRRGKLTVTRALEGDDERVRSVAAYRRHLQ